MCQEYILERYREDYDLRLKLMGGEEKKQLCDELIGTLCSVDSLATFCTSLVEGVTRGAVNFKIVNFNSQGCIDLHVALMDRTRAVARRAEKLLVFYTGEDEEEKPVWNGGNMYRTCPDPVRELLMSIGEEATWLKIKERYRCKGSHVYRGEQCKCNRHGHSNELPSYFAFGHELLLSFIGSVPWSDWERYQRQHPTCCGVARAIQDPEYTRLSVEHYWAKRARRVECESDQAKRDAAIGRRKARQKDRKMRGTLKAPQRGSSSGQGVVRAAASGESDGSEENVP